MGINTFLFMELGHANTYTYINKITHRYYFLVFWIILKELIFLGLVTVFFFLIFFQVLAWGLGLDLALVMGLDFCLAAG